MAFARSASFRHDGEPVRSLYDSRVTFETARSAKNGGPTFYCTGQGHCCIASEPSGCINYKSMLSDRAVFREIAGERARV